MAEHDLAIENYYALNPGYLFDVLDLLQIRQIQLPEQYQSAELYEVEMVIELWLRVLVDEYEDKRRLHLDQLPPVAAIGNANRSGHTNRCAFINSPQYKLSLTAHVTFRCL